MVMNMSYFNNKMLELIPGIFVITGNTNIGVITDQKDSITEVYIVDSGNTEVDGEYILETLDEYFKFSNIEYKVKAIINTHAHADHCGGNAIIQKNTQCEVWASHFEKGSLENPNYHTSILWGAIAPKEIDTIYYRPEPCTFTKSFCENDEFLFVVKLADRTAAIDFMRSVAGRIARRIRTGRQFAKRTRRTGMGVSRQGFDKMPARGNPLRLWQIDFAVPLKNIDTVCVLHIVPPPYCFLLYKTFKPFTRSFVFFLLTKGVFSI